MPVGEPFIIPQLWFKISAECRNYNVVGPHPVDLAIAAVIAKVAAISFALEFAKLYAEAKDNR